MTLGPNKRKMSQKECILKPGLKEFFQMEFQKEEHAIKKKKKSQNMYTESPMLESAETTNIRTAQGLSVLKWS